MDGVLERHKLIMERNRCTVVIPDESGLEVARGGYLLLTTLFGRSRHFAWTLLADVITLAERCEVSGPSAEASRILAEAADLQRRAVLARREMRATDYLGDPTLISLFHRAAPVAAVADYDRRALDDALDGLDRLVNGVFAVASDRSQRMLNQVGFFLAVINVLFAATGLTNLINTGAGGRVWVYVGWAGSLVILALVFGVARARQATAGYVQKTGRRG
jgi:hypothetical protein